MEIHAISWLGRLYHNYSQPCQINLENQYNFKWNYNMIFFPTQPLPSFPVFVLISDGILNKRFGQSSTKLKKKIAPIHYQQIIKKQIFLKSTNGRLN